MKNGPKPHWVNNSLRLCIAIALQLLVVFPNSSQLYGLEPGDVPSEVQDLRYGVVLYHFYQQSYFDALTESLVGEEKADMPFHGDSAELLRGGMSLSYGMGNKAEEIFNELLNTLEKDKLRNRAWFYLGKLYYLRGDKEAAQKVFTHIEHTKLEPELSEEFIYYNASVLLQHGKLLEADEIIEQLNDKSVWLAYYRFNRGAAQTVAGNWQQGVDLFQQIKSSSLKSSEGLVLKDRAYIASGFAYLGAEKYYHAMDDFVKVRLQSPLVDRAMLGYGWAQAQKQLYEKALAPWQALSKRSVLNPSVQESLLAIAYIYEKIQAPASALTEYINAADVFEKELVNIQEAVSLFRDAPISQILTEPSSLGSDWISGEDYLPLNKQAPYLAHLIAQDHFQAAINDHIDLNRMANFLRQSRQRYATLQGVLDLQQNVWQESLDNSLREKYRERYQRLLLLKNTLQEKTVLAEQEADGLRLVEPEQGALWRRVEQAQNRITLLKKADTDVSEESEALRLYRGLLVWRANEDYPIKQWEFKKQFTELMLLLKDTDDKLQRIEALSIDRLDAAFSTRMSATQQRIDVQSNSVKQALADSENTIRALAVQELLKQQQRLSYYLGQAKLAIARLYDAGSTEADL